MITPLFGSRGPGEQIPIPLTAIFTSELSSTALTADSTAPSPSAGFPFADIGIFVCCLISPLLSTRPAATFVPPTSTPTTNPSCD